MYLYIYTMLYGKNYGQQPAQYIVRHIVRVIGRGPGLIVQIVRAIVRGAWSIRSHQEFKNVIRSNVWGTLGCPKPRMWKIFSQLFSCLQT